jgi:hypothetical protein
MMQLNEISVKRDLKKYGSVASVLEKYGWHLLGYGLMATVAQHPTKPYALKIFRRDKGYEQFVQFCLENKGNRHLPRINKAVRPIPGTDYFYVRMEILNGIDKTQLYGLYKDEALYLALLAKQNHKLISGSASSELQTYLTNHNEDDLKPLDSWRDICIKLIAFANDHNTIALDNHSGNFMLRNHTLVIIDPFV